MSVVNLDVSMILRDFVTPLLLVKLRHLIEVSGETFLFFELKVLLKLIAYRETLMLSLSEI